MRVRHGGHHHEVNLLDSGTMGTTIQVDEKEVTFSEADRHSDGRVVVRWLIEAAREACEDGLLEGDDDQ